MIKTIVLDNKNVLNIELTSEQIDEIQKGIKEKNPVNYIATSFSSKKYIPKVYPKIIQIK